MCNVFSGIDPGRYECETRSVRLGGHATSLRLERAFWDLLDALADSQRMSLGQFLSELHEEAMAINGEVRNFASMLRCMCLSHLERTLGEDGMDRAMPAPPSRSRGPVREMFKRRSGILPTHA